jgi:protein transport protein SEC24
MCNHETQGMTRLLLWTGSESCPVSADYFSNLDANLIPMDLPNRPELNKGTIDFVVSGKEYLAPPPLPRMSSSYFSVDPPSSQPRDSKPLDYLFVLDVSVDAIRSGFLKSVCVVLRDLLYGGSYHDGTESESSFPRGCQLAILTYDTSLHFYNLSVSATRIIPSS